MCDFKSCRASVICKGKIFGDGPKSGSCNLKTEVNLKPSTAAREMQSFLLGFKELSKQSANK
jgi:hypothetical protein